MDWYPKAAALRRSGTDGVTMLAPTKQRELRGFIGGDHVGVNYGTYHLLWIGLLPGSLDNVIVMCGIYIYRPIAVLWMYSGVAFGAPSCTKVFWEWSGDFRCGGHVHSALGICTTEHDLRIFILTQGCICFLSVSSTVLNHDGQWYSPVDSFLCSQIGSLPVAGYSRHYHELVVPIDGH